MVFDGLLVVFNGQKWARFANEAMKALICLSF
jgi:hypothetical protein